jgi:hypothetical protein
LLLFVLVAACAADEPSAAASPNLSPQDRLLSRANVGNFACKVDSVRVLLDVAGDEDKTIVTADDIETYLSQTATLEWAHVNQFFFSSLDGRNTEKNLGTGGGDMGEFIQALESYTRVTGKVFTFDDVSKSFGYYLKTMSREKFFYETDFTAYRKLAIDTGCQNLKIATIGDKRKKEAILNKFADEDFSKYIGDPFIKYLAQNPDAGVRPEYITFAIQAFHTALWKNTMESNKLCYTEVKGKVDPKALIHVKTPGYCVDQGLAPLISSQICAGQAFIEHTDAVKLYRRELVQLLSEQGDNPQDVLAQFNSIAQDTLASFWNTFVGLPQFTVEFSHSFMNNITYVDEADQ